MEGGDHTEQVPQPVAPPEANAPHELNVEHKPDEVSETLTDSILDDDLVVIPSQSEVIEAEEPASGEQPVPDVVSGVADPSPLADPTPPAPTSVSEPAPSQPVTEPEPATEREAEPAPAPAPAPTQPSVPNPVPVEPITVVSPKKATPAPAMSSAKPAAKPVEDDDEDFEDESLMERLAGLSEMFPERLRTATSITLGLSFAGAKKLFSFGKSALWIGTTSFMILIVPVVLETEMVHMEQAQIQRQKQMLLGPNAATAGGVTGGMTPPIPGVSVAAAPSDSR